MKRTYVPRHWLWRAIEAFADEPGLDPYVAMESAIAAVLTAERERTAQIVLTGKTRTEMIDRIHGGHR